jgi:steroid delta-isomerase-like uncharacterized protein
MTKVEVHKAKHEAFNRGDLQAAAGFFAESATYTDHAKGVVRRGRQEIKAGLEEWKHAFGDAHITDASFLETENATISRFMGRGTNDGHLGELPATGRSVAFPMCDIFEYDSEGRVVKAEIFYDQLSVLQQLGHMPQSEPAHV